MATFGPSMKLVRRRFLASLGGLGAVALLAACSAPEAPATQAPAPAGTSAPTPAAKTDAAASPTAAPAAPSKPGSSEPVTVRLHARSGPEDDMWAEMLPKFEQAHNAKVQLEQVPGAEHIQKLQTLVAGDQLGDVIHVFTGDSSFHLFFSSGVLIPLDDYISRDSYDMGQYYEFCSETCKVDGKYGALPFKGHPSRCGIFYNKNLFDAAGVPYPTNDSTYDDLVEAATKLHKQNGSEVEVFGWTNPGRDMEWYIIMARFGGGDIYVNDGTQSGMTNPDSQWGWTWVYDMMNTHKVMLNPLQENPSATDLFRSGKIAMARLNIGTKASFASIDTFDWGMSVAPKGPKGQRGTLAQTDVVGVTKFSKNPDVAWELLKHITSKEAGIALGKQTGARSATPGGRPDVYESEELLNLPFPEGVQQNTLIAMAEAEPFIYPANYRGPEVARAINPLYEALILNQSQADQNYFTQLHQAIQDILDKPRP